MPVGGIVPPDVDATDREQTPVPPLDAALLGAPADAPTGGPPDDALVMVEALSVAWATFTLYQEPTGMEAFQRAVQSLTSGPRYPWRIEVRAEGFWADGHPVASRREAARRLARQVFAHGSAAIELTRPPTADDLLGLFAVLAEDPEAGDATERLFAAGITAIALLPRELLIREAEEAAADEAEATAWCTGYEGEPEPFVHTLLAELAEDPSELSIRFVDEYERVFGLISGDDHWGMEEVVHTFLDAFNYLPREHQAAVLDRLLARQDRRACLMFLDQLGGEELGDLARHLAAETHPLLIDYARIAAEQGERRHSELLRLLAVAEPAKPVRQTVVEQVDAALQDSPDGHTGARSALRRLRAAPPSSEDHTATGVKVVRGLMSLAADGSGSLAKVATVWAAKAAEAIRAGDLAVADTWLLAAGGLGLGPAEQNTLLAALAEQVDPPLVERVVTLMAQGGSPDGAVVLKAAPLFLIDGLIERIAGTEEAGRRKPLVEALVELAPHRPDALLRRLDDPRWYVVRNLVHALGRSHRPDLGRPLRDLLGHEDRRVRREVLRALPRLGGTPPVEVLLAALDDPHEDVRGEALVQLARAEDPSIDRELAGRLRAAGDQQTKLTAVAALGRRRTAASGRELTRLARRRFVFGAAARQLRNAARRALSAMEEEAHE